jgi:hypothetical protein
MRDPRGIQQDLALNFPEKMKGIIVFEEELRKNILKINVIARGNSRCVVLTTERKLQWSV